MADFIGTGGDDTQAGGAAPEEFDYSQGGHDTLIGGGGGDTFDMGAALDSLDSITGSADALDGVNLEGDYSAGLTITGAMFSGVDSLQLNGAFDYRLTLDGVSGDNGGTFYISSFTTGDCHVDASALSSDLFFSSYYGLDQHVVAGSGDDWFSMSQGFDRTSAFDGGDGSDLFQVSYLVNVHAADRTFRNIERIDLMNNGTLVLSDGTVAAGASLLVDGNGGAPLLIDGHKVIAEASLELKTGVGSGALIGGHGADSLTGWLGADTLTGGHGADTLTGRDGVDTFIFRSALDSGHRAPDLITDLEAQDVIDLSRVDADKTQAGDQAFTQVAAFGGHAGELTVSYDAELDVTSFAGDVDGDGRAEFVLHASGDHADFAGLVL